MSVGLESRSSEYPVPHALLDQQRYEPDAFRWFRRSLGTHLLSAFYKWQDSLSELGDDELTWIVKQYRDESISTDVSFLIRQMFREDNYKEYYGYGKMFDFSERITIGEVAEFVRDLEKSDQHGLYAKVDLPKNRITPAEVDNAYEIWMYQLFNWENWSEFHEVTGIPFGNTIDMKSKAMPRRIDMGGFSIELFFGDLYLPDFVRNPPYVKSFFDYFSQEYKAKADVDLKIKIYERLFSYVPEPAGRMIDLGCGHGTSTRWIWRDIRQDQAKVYGIDISEVMLKDAYHDLTGYQGDMVRAIPHPKDCFDNAVMCFGEHWVYNMRSFLDEVGRVLKPGGVFVYNVRRPEEWWQYKHQELLKSAGFVDIKTEEELIERDNEVYKGGYVVAKAGD